jgi:hypothetical protein
MMVQQVHRVFKATPVLRAILALQVHKVMQVLRVILV